MFVLFFPIQAAFSTLLTGPIGFFTAWISILQQAGLVSVFLVAFLLMPEIQRITFDAVLSNEFADDVVLLGKLRRIVKVPFWVKCGKLLWAIPAVFVLPYAVAKLLLMMLISTIPFIGPVLVVLLQAPSKGLQAHSRYFVLKGYDKRQVKAIYRANTGAYMGFGIVATILESIPFLSIFFMFTNNIGAALWVVTIEQKQKKEKAAQIKKIHEAN
ncbi:uncharacterized protein RJT20DRAFT_63020 [Scheffersomyces xylosifermentans]|uniref:uncharacterized protein n=1 Tax=Scheffersomyces xylosifermentans TaxID=1304137 RepID=UPI00315DCB81